MEIGKTKRVITVTPVELPRIKTEPVPVKEAPVRAPAALPERELVPVKRSAHETHVRGGHMRWQKRDDWRARYGTVPTGDPNRKR